MRKACICVTQLEPVSHLKIVAFLATLRCHILRRSKPSILWSDFVTKFVRAARKVRDLFALLHQQDILNAELVCCSTQNIDWYFTPLQVPRFREQ